MPETEHLSLENVQQIANETGARRELSHSEIKGLASMLNDTLSEYRDAEKLYSEPTSARLSEQKEKLLQALERLKRALVPLNHISLRYYLIHLGEAYAATKGQHPNLKPHYVGGVLDTGEEVSAIDHYHSDARLNEMVSSVSQVLEWMKNAPASMKKISNWWDRKPHWLEDDDELMWERLLTSPRDLPKDAHRRRPTEDLIVQQLPEIYERTFRTRFGVSETPPGPGVRFILAVIRHAKIRNIHNRVFSEKTVIKYGKKYRRARRVGSLLAGELPPPPVYRQPSELPAPPTGDNKPKK